MAFTPPPVFARWWAMAEACSGTTGSLESVAFYVVPNAASFQRNNAAVLGYWTSGGNQIVLAGNASLDGGNVRHEMLHALLRVGGHPRDQFLEKCGGTVDCGIECIADAGAAPAADPAALSVAPTALAVTVDVAPSAPTTSQDGGFFTVTVNVRNSATRPVIARLGPTNARALSFQYDVRGPTGGITGAKEVLDASTVTFAAGETKHQVFDFSIGTDLLARKLPPGAYTVRTAYGANFTAPVPVTVGP